MLDNAYFELNRYILPIVYVNKELNKRFFDIT